MENIGLSQTELEKMKKIIANVEQENQDPYERDSKGKILDTYYNRKYFATHHEEIAGKLKFNDFLQRKEYDGREFTDFEQNHIYALYDNELGIRSRGNIDVVISEMFSENRYNPIRDYITNLKWDGVERVERLFIDFLQADDTRLNRAMTMKWFMAAVKRVLHPGCKFDNMIVLRGGQGIGKSQICEKIAKKHYSSISLSEIDNKDVINKLNLSWVCIIDELDNFNKKEMSSIKTFLSTSNDTVRLAYARNANTYERHCVFIGSTNDDTFLRDSTSAVERRFWVIDCKREKYDSSVIEMLTPEYVDQLWAEAAHKLTDDTYLDLESDLIEDFSIKQVEFKTYTTDVAIDYANELLDKKYNNPQTAQQMFLQASNEDNVGGSVLDKVPVSWLTYCLKKIYGTERSGKYMATALADNWLYRSGRIKSQVYKCLVRRKNELFEYEDED